MTIITVLLFSFLGAVSTAQASAVIFSSPANSGPFTLAGTLDYLSETLFTALAHPAFPCHGMHIKKSHFCDETVNTYTGYIDISEAHHLFFYFFESRSEPDKDNIIFWTNGGLGCLSSTGLFMELGPCRVVNAENGMVFHQESWNSKVNVFFIDQPISVGFSYAEYGKTVGTTEDPANDIAAFVAIFFAHFTKFQGQGIHMAGESYGGQYLPLFTAAIYEQNPHLVEAGLPLINLVSVMIGNRMLDVLTMMLAWFEMQCSSALVVPVQDIQTCVQMKAMLPRCKKWMKESCQDQFNLINCNTAMSFCETALLKPYLVLTMISTGLSLYDVTKKCEGDSGLCYTVIEEIIKYLNKKDVQAQLGVKPGVYMVCSETVGNGFTGATDYIAGLLEHGVHVLIFAGSYDWVCSWIGNERWTVMLEWSGQVEFSVQLLREWTVGCTRAGKMCSAKGMMFATVDAAGHMVHYDKPKESLEMVNI
ncbi:Alpha/Beta hydrolase protein [Mycena sp. CBHHK59/15]|nr:Alpha/Beta hydrolase protein [Mycena sp. CBHHK59/15]